MKKIVFLVSIFTLIAVMVFGGCTASKPKFTAKPIVTPQLQTEYSESLVLSEGEAAKPVGLSVSPAGIVSLTVGESTALTFQTRPEDAKYKDGCKLSAYLMEEGTLIFAVPQSDKVFFANVAYYDGAALYEVSFPFGLEEYTEDLFTGAWSSDDTFSMTPLLGGEDIIARIDKPAFEFLAGRSFETYLKRNIFGVKGTAFNSISDDGSRLDIDVTLGYELNWSFAVATITLQYDVSKKAYTYSGVAYEMLPVAECGVTSAGVIQGS